MSLRVSIQCASWVSGREGNVLIGDGSGSVVGLVRTNRSRAGIPDVWPGNTGSQRDAGATDASGENLRGPLRRS